MLWPCCSQGMAVLSESKAWCRVLFTTQDSLSQYLIICKYLPCCVCWYLIYPFQTPQGNTCLLLLRMDGEEQRWCRAPVVPNVRVWVLCVALMGSLTHG